MRLTTYAEWKECIEVHCDIPLTPAFIKERLAELSDRNHPKTQEFEKLYGNAHREQVVTWFRQAGAEAS